MTHPSQFRCAALACLLAVVPDTFAQDPTKDFAKGIFRDQKRIWTSPFRMKKRDVKWWLIFAATGALIATDHRTSQQLPNTADQAASSKDVSRLGAVYTLIPIAGGLYLGGLMRGHSRLHNSGFLGGQALIDSLIVSEVLKAATGRQRPLEGDGGGHFFHGSESFLAGRQSLTKVCRPR